MQSLFYLGRSDSIHYGWHVMEEQYQSTLLKCLGITLYLSPLVPGQKHRENTVITEEYSTVALSRTVFSVSLTKRQDNFFLFDFSCQPQFTISYKKFWTQNSFGPKIFRLFWLYSAQACFIFLSCPSTSVWNDVPLKN